ARLGYRLRRRRLGRRSLRVVFAHENGGRRGAALDPNLARRRLRDAALRRAIVFAALGGALLAWALALIVSAGNTRTMANEVRAGVRPRIAYAESLQRARGGWILALFTALAIAGGGAAVAAARWIPQ